VAKEIKNILGRLYGNNPRFIIIPCVSAYTDTNVIEGRKWCEKGVGVAVVGGMFYGLFRSFFGLW
jgi:hypothetical protein